MSIIAAIFLKDIHGVLLVLKSVGSSLRSSFAQLATQVGELVGFSLSESEKKKNGGCGPPNFYYWKGGILD